MNRFDTELCAIPVAYCGNAPNAPARKRGDETYYDRMGTGYECMQKGFGGGLMTERSKNLPVTSLQRIKYLGEGYEVKFRAKNINNIAELVEYAKWSSPRFGELLNEVLVKKNGVIDKRARNSILLHVYKMGVDTLPACDRL